ncbi:MAG TPA: D-glycero-beta-D-manno-heptose 1,7-bisphosphate 7-phosphatase [Phototrophicaceae bacterium]|nr:D-glycero-beta-D-manno-heptose 1,7-bisphosphate 7-phosphatase [Phototrophicaceae bacterium]
MMGQTGAIFLDRDGVINQNRIDHVKSWDEFEFVPGALESIRALTETGLPIFVVTNQAVINRGMVSIETLDGIHNRMQAEVRRAGGCITKVYHCPHDNHEACTCRKPEPGMLQHAAQEFNIDLRQSYMVGDAWTDVAAGVAVGARSILVLTGRGRWNFVSSWDRFGLDFAAACDLQDAVDMIKESLHGNQMSSTARLRSAFHMALHPETTLVL